jgi:hypothetical protein
MMCQLACILIGTQAHFAASRIRAAAISVLVEEVVVRMYDGDFVYPFARARPQRTPGTIPNCARLVYYTEA